MGQNESKLFKGTLESTKKKVSQKGLKDLWFTSWLYLVEKDKTNPPDK